MRYIIICIHFCMHTSEDNIANNTFFHVYFFHVYYFTKFGVASKSMYEATVFIIANYAFICFSFTTIPVKQLQVQLYCLVYLQND